MVSTDAIARTLRSLADRTATARPSYAGVVDEAVAARDDLERAAVFVNADGLDRLADAVAAARRDGHDGLARRGRDAMEDYERLQEAATSSRNPAPSSRNPYITEDARSDE